MSVGQNISLVVLIAFHNLMQPNWNIWKEIKIISSTESRTVSGPESQPAIYKLLYKRIYYTRLNPLNQFNWFWMFNCNFPVNFLLNRFHNNIKFSLPTAKTLFSNVSNGTGFPDDSTNCQSPVTPISGIINNLNNYKLFNSLVFGCKKKIVFWFYEGKMLTQVFLSIATLGNGTRRLFTLGIKK